MKNKSVIHNYFGKELIFTEDWYKVIVKYKDQIIYKRYFGLILITVPSLVFPDVFCRFDDSVIKQLVNEIFDGAL